MKVVRGTVFEIEVSMTLAQIPNSTVISNLWVPSKSLGKPTEIDRLLVTPWGIYSVEAKSFMHGLVGEVNDTTWAGYTGRTKTPIYNPVMQNFEHIRTLKCQLHRLGKIFIPVHNAVVVPNTCEIQTNCNLVFNLNTFITKVLTESVTEPKINFSTEELINLVRKVEVV